jgi:hypothetical protein
MTAPSRLRHLNQYPLLQEKVKQLGNKVLGICYLVKVTFTDVKPDLLKHLTQEEFDDEYAGQTMIKVGITEGSKRLAKYYSENLTPEFLSIVVLPSSPEATLRQVEKDLLCIVRKQVTDQSDGKQHGDEYFEFRHLVNYKGAFDVIAEHKHGGQQVSYIHCVTQWGEEEMDIAAPFAVKGDWDGESRARSGLRSPEAVRCCYQRQQIRFHTAATKIEAEQQAAAEAQARRRARIEQDRACFTKLFTQRNRDRDRLMAWTS